MENFDLMKSDYKMMQQEMIKMVEDRSKEIKMETDEALMRQMSFIEESGIRSLQAMKENK